MPASLKARSTSRTPRSCPSSPGFARRTRIGTLDLVDASVEADRRQILEQFRSQRDSTKVAAALEKIATVAASTENLMPATIEAVEAGVTLGEIATALQAVFGEYKDA